MTKLQISVSNFVIRHEKRKFIIIIIKIIKVGYLIQLFELYTDTIVLLIFHYYTKFIFHFIFSANTQSLSSTGNCFGFGISFSFNK